MSLRSWLYSITVLVLAALALWSCSGGGTDDDDDGDDGNTPYNIFDFRIAGVSDSSVMLAWTATGDDSNSGTAAKYDLRVFDEWITVDLWDEAIPVLNVPKPKVAGSAELFEVVGLDKDSTYYFALMPCDEGNNCAYFSCAGPATCFTDVVVDFPDTALEHVVRTAIQLSIGDIHRSDLLSFTFLDANWRGIESLSGLEYCTALYAAFINGNEIVDLSPLAELYGILYLQAGNNDIASIAPLTNLHHITGLSLQNNPISDLTPLITTDRLHILWLNNCPVTDLGPLLANPDFSATDTLYVSGCPLSDNAIDVQIPALQARGVEVIR